MQPSGAATPEPHDTSAIPINPSTTTSPWASQPSHFYSELRSPDFAPRVPCNSFEPEIWALDHEARRRGLLSENEDDVDSLVVEGPESVRSGK